MDSIYYNQKQCYDDVKELCKYSNILSAFSESIFKPSMLIMSKINQYEI